MEERELTEKEAIVWNKWNVMAERAVDALVTEKIKWDAEVREMEGADHEDVGTFGAKDPTLERSMEGFDVERMWKFVGGDLAHTVVGPKERLLIWCEESECSKDSWKLYSRSEGREGRRTSGGMEMDYGSTCSGAAGSGAVSSRR